MAELASKLEEILGWRLRVARLSGRVVVVASDPMCAHIEMSGDSWSSEVMSMLESVGVLELCLVAEGSDFPGGADGLESERLRFEAWRAIHPDVPLDEYNTDPKRPAPEFAWYQTCLDGEPRNPILLRLPRSLTEHFGILDLTDFSESTDSFGHQVIGWRLTARRVSDFLQVVEKNSDSTSTRRMAILMHGYVVAIPTAESLVGVGASSARSVSGVFRACPDDIFVALKKLSAKERVLLFQD